MGFANRRQFLWMAVGGGAALGLGGAWFTRGGERSEGLKALGSHAGLHAVRQQCWALGTEVSLTVLADCPETGQRAVEAALAEVRLVDRLMSLYRPDSQVSQLNREGIIAAPHRYLVSILRAAEAMSLYSEGAFDVTVQPLWSLYAEAAAASTLPDSAAIASVRSHVNWRRVQLAGGVVRLSGDGTAITLNGIAQGFAADRVAATLRRHGIQHALINTGEIAALGSRDDETPWNVGIQHPRRQDAYQALAQLQGRCLSTSGDYATTFSKDRSHHHLFDPRTGRSPHDFSSVSIVAATAVEADALSTTVFVLGPERGLELVQATPGADALLVFKDGKMLTTDGFPTSQQEQQA